MTRFLICGMGSVGRRHLRNLRELGQEDIVLYRTGRSTLPNEELDGLEVEGDLGEALDRWRPDAVLVTNPTARHMEVAIPAARAGCHVFIEKPISNSMDEVGELKQALATGGGSTLVGYHFRFNPGLHTAKRLLEDGVVGRAITARVYWGEYLPDWHPWEDYHTSYSARSDLGGGVVLTLSHPFDYLRWLLGEVVEVGATSGNSGTLGIEVEDHAVAFLTMDADVLASVQIDYLRRPPAHWLEIVGTGGVIRWDGLEGRVLWYDGDRTTEQMPEGFERNSMFVDEMRHFLRVIEAEEEPACSLKDGIRALEIALAVHQSAREGANVALSGAGVRA